MLIQRRERFVDIGERDVHKNMRWREMYTEI